MNKSTNKYVDRNLRTALGISNNNRQQYNKITSNNKKVNNKCKMSKKLLKEFEKAKEKGERFDQNKIDFLTTVAISDYEDDNYDVVDDNHKYGISMTDIKKSTYNIPILKMMRTFGDCEKPSRLDN